MSSYALLPNSRSDPDNIYYTANIINNNTTTGGTQNDPSAVFNETRDVPILRDANDYTVTILKVSINGAGKDLPILIPQIRPGPTDPILGGLLSASCATGGQVVGSVLTYTVVNTYGLLLGDKVTVSGVTGNAGQQKFNQVNMIITGLTQTTFTALSTSAGPGTAVGNQITVAQPNVIITGGGVNNTIYTMTLNAAIWTSSAVKLVTSGPVNIQWISELFDLATAVPTTNLPSQTESDYYYMYSYNHWIVLVNKCLQEAYRRLGIYAAAAVSGYTLKNRCPTVEYDETTGKFSFYTDTLGTSWGLTEGPPTAQYLGPSGTNVFPTGSTQEFMYVGYNNNFDLLMTNFDTQYFGKDQVIWGNTVSGPSGVSTTVYVPENTLIVRNKTGTNIQAAIDPTTGLPFSPSLLSYVTTQDFESTSSIWSPVASIVLTTTLIPIRSEFVSAPVVLGSGNTKNGQGTSGTASFQTVLADFSENISGDKWRGMIVFTPAAEFIPVSLTTSHQEIKNVDFKINWRNRLTNQLIPLILPNTSSVSVRLLFKRKQG